MHLIAKSTIQKVEMQLRKPDRANGTAIEFHILILDEDKVFDYYNLVHFCVMKLL